MRVSLRAELAASSTWTLATPAVADCKVAVAIPAAGVTDTTLKPFVAQVPIVVANITLVVGEGAVTVTSNESPICIAEALGLAGTTPVPAFSVTRLMPKVVEALAATVKLLVAVAPTAATVTVTVPAVAPATETVSLPLASVVPLAGVSVTVPEPVWVSATVAPETGEPPASFAVIVSVAGDVPLASNEVPVALNVSVEPTICTGSKAVAAPAVAVMVAVRLALLALPEEKIAVALPVASVVIVVVLSSPVSALRVIVAPDTAALLASTAVTVIVLEFELSELTVVGEPDI